MGDVTTAAAVKPEQWRRFGRCEISLKPGWREGESRYQIAGSPEDAKAATAELRWWLRPAGVALVDALHELYTRTARRAEGDEDKIALGALYARELSAFPADRALDAIRNYRGTFFPALDDLRGPLERDEITRDRRQRLAALESFCAHGPTPPVKRVTPEQAAAIRAKYGRDKSSPVANFEWSERDIESLRRVDAIHGDRAKTKGFMTAGEIAAAAPQKPSPSGEKL